MSDYERQHFEMVSPPAVCPRCGKPNDLLIDPADGKPTCVVCRDAAENETGTDGDGI